MQSLYSAVSLSDRRSPLVGHCSVVVAFSCAIADCDSSRDYWAMADALSDEAESGGNLLGAVMIGGD